MRHAGFRRRRVHFFRERIRHVGVGGPVGQDRRRVFRRDVADRAVRREPFRLDPWSCPETCTGQSPAIQIELVPPVASRRVGDRHGADGGERFLLGDQRRLAKDGIGLRILRPNYVAVAEIGNHGARLWIEANSPSFGPGSAHRCSAGEHSFGIDAEALGLLMHSFPRALHIFNDRRQLCLRRQAVADRHDHVALFE